MSFYSELCDLCKEIECEYLVQPTLKDYTSFNIGGVADLMVCPDTVRKK